MARSLHSHDGFRPVVMTLTPPLFEMFYRTRNGEMAYSCELCGARQQAVFERQQLALRALLEHVCACARKARADVPLAGFVTLDGLRSAACVNHLDGKLTVSVVFASIAPPRHEQWHGRRGEPESTDDVWASEEECPTSEAIAVLIDGRAEREERRKLIEHFAVCERCWALFASSTDYPFPLASREDARARRPTRCRGESVLGKLARLASRIVGLDG